MTARRSIDPTDLDAIRGAVGLDQPDSRLQPIGMARIVIGPDALSELPLIVQACREPGPVAVVMDRTPMSRRGVDLKSLVVDRLRPIEPDVRPVVLGIAGHELHADAEAIAAAVLGARGAGIIVSVGSGTICDVAKEASRELGIPQVVVQTANSVNAFSDDMAVLLINGVKRTVPSRWPDALVVDLTVLAEAPAELNRAGVGELTAMFTAPADWRLAAAVGIDPTWDRRVVDLFRDGADELVAAAPGAAGDDLEAHGILARLMTLSGLALGIAGRTAPISGTEHTVSHLLDMSAAQSGGRTGLHGAQVGVAALAVAVAWQRLLDAFDPERLVATATPDAATMRARIGAAFASLDPSGVVAEECWAAYSRKLRAWDAARADRLPAFVRDWDVVRDELRGLVGAPERIAAVLRSAGAPAAFGGLDPAATPETATWALLNGHLMRDRFTLADLAFFGGAWSESIAREAIEEATAIADAAGVAPSAAPAVAAPVAGS